MFPYRDENPTYRTPVITVAIIVINVAVWVLIEGAGTNPALARAICELGTIPGEVLHTLPPGLQIRVGPGLSCQLSGGFAWYTLLTSMFMHGGWLHIIGNMVYFWAFGPEIEDAMGRFRFLVFYLAGGVFATMAQVLASPGSHVPNLGASGAIAAVMGAFLFTFPNDRIRTVVFIGFFFTITIIPSLILVGLWFVLQLFSEIGSITVHSSGGIAYMAHIGGIIFGLLTARIFEKRERAAMS
jgi:membrane associated rhomboid family serine protease